jgi:hypothetical protein
MNSERQLNPTSVSDAELDRLAFAIMGKIKEHYTSGSENPMTRKEIAKYLKCSVAQVDKLIQSKILKPRRLGDGKFPRFFPSEIEWK